MFEAAVALFLELLADPRVRAALVALEPVARNEAKKVVLDVIQEIFHPHQKADPDFPAKSAAITKALITGTTEDKDAAQKALLALMATPA